MGFKMSLFVLVNSDWLDFAATLDSADFNPEAVLQRIVQELCLRDTRETERGAGRVSQLCDSVAFRGRKSERERRRIDEVGRD